MAAGAAQAQAPAQASAQAQAAAPASKGPVLSAASAQSVDFPAIAERYGPAVVNISTAGQDPSPATGGPGPIDPDDPFYAFFKRSMLNPEDAQSSPPPRVVWGSGSGFIISADGMILTTAHIVNRADDITVKLTDHREYKASVVTIDVPSDLAILKIDATKLTPVRLGDSSHVRVGEPVLTIGTPYGDENTVTAGLVSASSHALPDGSSFPFMQTDVATNPDNSGGPVFNRAGEVIGVDVQIYADGERYQSLTFAIPINMALKLRTQMQVQGKLIHGNVGIEVQDVDAGLARAFGLQHAAGAVVTAVLPTSPTNGGGVQPGDVIVQVGDKPVERSSDFVDYVASLVPGTKVSLRLLRNRRPAMATVTVVAADGSAGNAQDAGSALERLGLFVRPLGQDERHANALASGVMIEGVTGPAANAGIRAGDIVLSLNGTPVSTRDQLATVAAQSGKELALLILRDNTRSFVSVELK
jgi:Do/DeqQ family serine protease